MGKARMGMWVVLLTVAAWASWLAVGMVHPQQKVRLTAVLYVSQGWQPGAYSVVGSPTISASFIDQVLSAYHSPAAGLGSVIENQGEHYGIDPVYALAFFWHESGFGTTGEARVTLSPGNERCLPIVPASTRTGAATRRCRVGRMASTTGIASSSPCTSDSGGA